MKKRAVLKALLNILFVIGIFIILGYLIKNSLRDILAQLFQTPPLIVGGVILCGSLYILVEGENLRKMAGSFQKTFSRGDGALAMCYAAFYRLVTFGAGTLVAEVNFYHSKGLRLSQGVGVTALHMVMYKVTLFTWALISLILQLVFFQGERPLIIWAVLFAMVVTFVIVAVLLSLTLSLKFQVLFVKFSNKFMKRKQFRNAVDKINLQIYSLREAVDSILLERPLIFRIYLLNLLKVVFWFVIPYLVLASEHPELNFFLAFGLTSFAVILAGSIPTPAGIGSFEFVYLLLFKPLVGTVDAVSSLLLYRFASYVWPFLIGFGYFLVSQRRKIQTEIQESKEDEGKEET